jgi:hypothetical protein
MMRRDLSIGDLNDTAVQVGCFIKERNKKYVDATLWMVVVTVARDAAPAATDEPSPDRLADGTQVACCIQLPGHECVDE